MSLFICFYFLKRNPLRDAKFPILWWEVVVGSMRAVNLLMEKGETSEAMFLYFEVFKLHLSDFIRRKSNLQLHNQWEKPIHLHSYSSIIGNFACDFAKFFSYNIKGFFIPVMKR